MTDPFMRKGDIFRGPDGKGYTLLCDVFSGQILSASQFEPFGGADEPKPGEPLPIWLVAQMWRRSGN